MTPTTIFITKIYADSDSDSNIKDRPFSVFSPAAYLSICYYQPPPPSASTTLRPTPTLRNLHDCDHDFAPQKYADSDSNIKDRPFSVFSPASYLNICYYQLTTTICVDGNSKWAHSQHLLSQRHCRDLLPMNSKLEHQKSLPVPPDSNSNIKKKLSILTLQAQFSGYVVRVLHVHL